MSEKFQAYMAVWLLLEKNGNILLSRRCNTGWMDGYYTLVSGHVEADEGAVGAMIREAREEAGLELNPDSISVAHVMHRKSSDREYIDIYFVATKWEGEARNMELDKCDDMQWFPMQALPTNTVPNLVAAINAISQKKFYSELGFE